MLQTLDSKGTKETFLFLCFPLLTSVEMDGFSSVLQKTTSVQTEEIAEVLFEN